MTTDRISLSQETLDAVLFRLGLADNRPDISPEGLARIYGAWCRNVPFDNVRKRMHLASGNRDELPGTDPEDFFNAWLMHGTAGTCWAGSTALHALLTSLGFNATRGLCTILATPDAAPNHATTVVHFGDDLYVVDSSLLFVEPFHLSPEGFNEIDHPAYGVMGKKVDGQWVLYWRPLHAPDGIGCRIESYDISAGEYREYHERTRSSSIFNRGLYARIVRGESVLGIAMGQLVEFDEEGNISSGPLDHGQALHVLADQFQMDEEFVAQMPEDEPTILPLKV